MCLLTSVVTAVARHEWRNDQRIIFSWEACLVHDDPPNTETFGMYCLGVGQIGVPDISEDEIAAIDFVVRRLSIQNNERGPILAGHYRLAPDYPAIWGKRATAVGWNLGSWLETFRDNPNRSAGRGWGEYEKKYPLLALIPQAGLQEKPPWRSVFSVFEKGKESAQNGNDESGYRDIAPKWLLSVVFILSAVCCFSLGIYCASVGIKDLQRGRSVGSVAVLIGFVFCQVALVLISRFGLQWRFGL